jgi:hypothetical protein
MGVREDRGNFKWGKSEIRNSNDIVVSPIMDAWMDAVYLNKKKNGLQKIFPV